MNKLVSIAMCSHNGERFIKEQIDSILAQTYSNFELIIVDDDSTDSTVDIINDYVKKDSRIEFFQNKKNLGFVKNFEKAIGLCSGDYIALADQDDVWKKDKLKVFIDSIGDNLLIYSDAILIDQFSKETGKQLIRPNGNLAKGKCNKAFIFYNFVSGNTLMFKKELIKNILPIPKQMAFHDIWIAFVASTVGTITYTDESYTYYRRYNEQVTAEKSRPLFDKLGQLKNDARRYIDVCTGFRTAKGINNDTVTLLNAIIAHYENFECGYFNFKMYKCLNKYKDEVFAIKRKTKRYKYVIKFSRKLKLRNLFL